MTEKTSLPLEKRKFKHTRLTDGGIKKEHEVLLPAFDKLWISDINFLPFHPYTRDTDTQEWISETELIIEDLNWLLNQPCHIFWSHLIFDDSLRCNIDGFLSSFARDVDVHYGDDMVASQNALLYKTYFTVILRMSTCKESKDDFITPEVFGEILYENFILDIPKIIDICSIFGTGNQALVSKMITNVFKFQPKYMSDLEVAIPTFEKVFSDMKSKVMQSEAVPRQFKPVQTMSPDDLHDVMQYISDTCHSLHAFLSLYSAACEPFHKANFYKSLCSCYEDILIPLCDDILEKDQSETILQEQLGRLSMAKTDCVKLFRLILSSATLEKLGTDSSNEDLVQQFLDIMTEHLGESRFIADYGQHFSFEEDVRCIRPFHKSLEDYRVEFIQDGVLRAMSHCVVDPEPSTQRRPVCGTALLEPSPESNGHPSKGLEGASGFDGGGISGSDFRFDQVHTVKDLFPDLGDGFIEMCLQYFDYKTEDVINALLENNLAPSLAKVDRHLERTSDSNILTARQSVYDHDQFDVFHANSVKVDQMHKGKRRVVAQLADESVKVKVKELASKMAAVELEAENQRRMALLIAGGSNVNEYEDEYDDTYDDNNVGADDADSADELLGRRVVMPLALGGRVESGDNNEEENDISDVQRNETTSSSSSIKDRGPSHHKPVYEVKGKPKGQGQSEEVLRNRQFKDQHKGRMANHNRKAAASRKMAKGMY